jgi:chaperone modulatory protein CbpM
MIDLYSEDDVVASVTRLTRKQLVSFVQARVVTPKHSVKGPVYHQMDIVRLELLCELSEQFDLQDEALGVVISLIDQLHGVRGELRTVVDAIASEPDDVQDRIRHSVRLSRSGL